MIQIDLFKVKAFLKKHSITIFVIVALLIWLKGCNNTDKTLFQIKNAKKEVLEAKKLVKVLTKKVEVSEKEITKYKDTLVFLDSQNQKHLATIDELSKQRNVSNKEMKKYTLDGISGFIAKRYNSEKSVFKIDNGITIKDSIPLKIALELNDYDYTQKLLTENEKILKIVNEKSFVKDSIISLQDNQKKNLKFAIDTQSFTIDNQENIIKDQFNVIRKEKRKNIFYKYAFPISVVGGLIGGFLIAK